MSCGNADHQDLTNRKGALSKIQLNPLEYNLQNLPKDSLVSYLINLIDSNQKFDLNSQLQLVDALSDNKIEVDSSFFHPDVWIIYQLLAIGDHLKEGDIFDLLEDLKLSSICGVYPQICYYLELRFEETFSQEAQDYLQKLDYHFNDFTDLFLTIKFLHQVGYKVYLLGIDLSLSSFFKAFHLLESLEIYDDCPRLIATINSELVISIQNHERDFRPLKNDQINKAESILKKLKEQSKLKLIQREKNKKLGIENYSIAWIDASTLDNKTKRYLATDVAFEAWGANPQMASEYLKYALEIQNQNTCSEINSVIKNYLLVMLMESDDSQEAEKLLMELNDFSDCKGSELLNRRFQNINYQPEVLSLLNPNYDRTQLIDSLYLHRALGDELFKDQPDHLGDFYAINAIKIYKYLSELKELKPKYKSLALELMNNTKQREFNRIRKLSEDEDASESDQRLKELLNEIDYFNKPKDYSDPIYPEIFQRALQAHINHSEVVAESPAVTKDYSQYVNSTAVKNQTLNFINSIGVYAGYIYNTKGLQIFEWDQGVVDSLAISLQEKILDKKPYAEEVKRFKNILFESLEIDTTEDITIIPDGPLAGLPFELLLNQELSYDYELKTEKAEKILIDQNQTTLISYSNEKTILKEMQAQEDSMVRVRTAQVERSDYEELTYGFIECNSINELLDEDPALYAGDQANKENFFKAFNQDLLHVSAHAYTNAESKYDNYIILRNEDSSPKKIYSYEIETHGPSPKVVILSACQTGIGSFTEGVGTYSISRAFITNGSEAVIKTLWKINDLTSKEFMVQLYKHWLKGFSLQEALNLTKSDFKRNNRYTAFDWAGFILEGNGNIYLEQ